MRALQRTWQRFLIARLGTFRERHFRCLYCGQSYPVPSLAHVFYYVSGAAGCLHALPLGPKT
jgi:hypothetical protein